jgi:hypothetical protein
MGKNKEERFFKAYYVFLKQIIGPYSRYEINCDEKQLEKHYRWSKLHYLINESRRRDWGLRGRNIRNLFVRNFKTDNLLQLTDILLGCHFTTATSAPKTVISNTVLNHGEAKKFRHLSFTPPKL